eukprot:scaffold12338_cov119-Isochrysis_galbana.AAC.5
MSISSYASDLSAASHLHSCEITQSNPSPQSGMVQPVVNEMFATVHAAGSSLLGLFTSCTTFDSTPTWYIHGGCALVGVLISRELVCLLVRRSLLSLGPGAEGRSQYLGGGSPLPLFTVATPSRASSSG